MDLKKAQSKVESFSLKLETLQEDLNQANEALREDPTDEGAAKVRAIREKILNVEIALDAAKAAEKAALDRERLAQVEDDKKNMTDLEAWGDKWAGEINKALNAVYDDMVKFTTWRMENQPLFTRYGIIGWADKPPYQTIDVIKTDILQLRNNVRSRELLQANKLGQSFKRG